MHDNKELSLSDPSVISEINRMAKTKLSHDHGTKGIVDKNSYRIYLDCGKLTKTTKDIVDTMFEADIKPVRSAVVQSDVKIYPDSHLGYYNPTKPGYRKLLNSLMGEIEKLVVNHAKETFPTMALVEVVTSPNVVVQLKEGDNYYSVAYRIGISDVECTGYSFAMTYKNQLVVKFYCVNSLGGVFIPEEAFDRLARCLEHNLPSVTNLKDLNPVAVYQYLLSLVEEKVLGVEKTHPKNPGLDTWDIDIYYETF